MIVFKSQRFGPPLGGGAPRHKRRRDQYDTRKSLACLVPGVLLHGCTDLRELEVAHTELGHFTDVVQTSASLDHATAVDTKTAVVHALDAAHTVASRVLATKEEVTTDLILVAS